MQSFDSVAADGSAAATREIVAPAPVAARPRARVEVRPARRKRWLLLDTAVVLAAVTLFGLHYYVMPVGERLRSPMNVWFRPSGYIGQSAGILAFAMFSFLWLYPLRKKFRALAFTGSIARWLDVHIYFGLVIPWLGAIHASWRFDGLIGLGYFAMLTVSLSGLVGRYLYVRIPRSRSGLELTAEQIDAERRATFVEIARTTGLRVEQIASALERLLGRGKASPWSLLSNEVVRWRAVRALRRQWGRDAAGRRLPRAAVARAVRLARREIALTQQMRMLDVTHRIFRYWHVAHRPVAITALVAVTAHVVTVVALGVTWLW